MVVLRATSVLADAAEHHYRAIFEYLARAVDRELDFIGDLQWERRQVELELGNIELGCLCGAHVAMSLAAEPVFSVLGAPVYDDPVGDDRPIYYSDVVVATSSDFQRMGDVRDKRLAFNEPGSFSGYLNLKAHLAKIGAGDSYFAEEDMVGSHRNAIAAIVAGEADCAAIDHYALGLELELTPELKGKLRVIERVGPHPSPPMVAHRSLDPSIREELARALCSMHDNPEGRAILTAARTVRFAPLDPTDYLPMIR